MYSKAEIFNLALGALLLTKEISDPATDPSKECRVLNVHWNTALRSTLVDLDLDMTTTEKLLELIEENPTDLWLYAYKYPSNCAFFRRIQTSVLKDTRRTKVPLRMANHNGVKVIFTNAEDAIGEYIPYDASLNLLNPSAGLAVAYRLAQLSAPLVVGKGALALRKDISSLYVIAKAEAQEHDRLENADFDDDETISEFVETRLS